MKRRRGFTLLEVLAAMLIVSVLAGLAVPGYRHVLQRARRSDAREALLRLQALQERYYFEHGRYAGSLESLGPAADTGRSRAGYYLLETRTDEDGESFVLSARVAPAGAQREDRACRELRLDETGRRSAAGDAADADASCWN